MNVRFDHLAKVLLLLYDNERRGERPFLVSELADKARISRSVFFMRLKKKLEDAGLVEFRVNPDRTVTVHLTVKGRRLAECLKQCEDILREVGVIGNEGRKG